MLKQSRKIRFLVCEVSRLSTQFSLPHAFQLLAQGYRR